MQWMTTFSLREASRMMGLQMAELKRVLSTSGLSRHWEAEQRVGYETISTLWSRLKDQPDVVSVVTPEPAGPRYGLDQLGIVLGIDPATLKSVLTLSGISRFFRQHARIGQLTFEELFSRFKPSH